MPLAHRGAHDYMDRHDSAPRRKLAPLDIRLGLTFDDVLLVPAESDIVPSQTNTGDAG